MYRNEQLAAHHQLANYPLPRRCPRMVRLFALRRARAAAGVAGVTGAAAAWIAAAACHLGFTDGFVTLFFLPYSVVGLLFICVSPIIALTWLAVFTLTEDLQVGLPKVRRTAVDPLKEIIQRTNDNGDGLRGRVAALDTTSLVWPLRAIVLTVPISLHLLVLLATGAMAYDDFTYPDIHSPMFFGYSQLPFAAWGWWVVMSIALTWLPHLVLCHLVKRFCCQLAASGAATARRPPERSVWVIASRHLLLTAASVIPSCLVSFLVVVLLWGVRYSSMELFGSIEFFGFVTSIAAVITFATGLAFLPLAYWWARKRYRSEQEFFTQPS